ncbi:MAG: ABC transporter permease [Candidatus Aminicenantes bacterium]|jgi:ABC-type antimicrobial peptide transport system permease subunit
MKRKKDAPPALAVWILSRIARGEEHLSILSDFSEIYEAVVSEEGTLKANIWYWTQVMRSIPMFVINHLYWSVEMIKNYLKIALRNLKRYKAYSFINVAGLAIGLTCCITISLWVIDELNFDKFHENCDRLYQIVGYRTADGFDRSQNETPVLLAPALQEEFPEVVASSRYRSYGRILLTIEDKTFYENRVRFVDPSFLKMFSFNFLLGDEKSALNALHSIVLTEDAAKKYFSDENPIGKSLVFNNDYELLVTGVLENSPYNSTLQFDVLLPYQFREELDTEEGYKPSWGHNTTSTFVQLRGNSTKQVFDSKITLYIKEKIINTYPREIVEKHQEDIQNQVINLTSVALKNIRFAPSHGGSTRIMHISIFSAVAFIILLTACINFTILSTARSSKRAKEIGLRKVVGAQRKNLIKQFLSESILLSFIALLIAVVLFIVLLPVFSNMINRDLPVSFLTKSHVIPLLLTITIFTGFAGGFYPALLLSSMQPVMTIKGDFRSGEKRTALKKVLVVFQFVVSISLMIGTFIIYKQIEYVKNINLGYDKEHVVCLRLNSGSIKYIDALKNNLKNNTQIINITGSYQHPAYISGRTMSADWQGKDPRLQTHIGNFRVDYDYAKTMKIDLLAGRDFSREFPNDVRNNFIINEQMATLMGHRHPIDAVGRQLMYSGRNGIIVGVVQDFHYKPLRQDIGPVVMTLLPDMVRFLLIRISPGDISSTLNLIKSKWQNIIPSYPFEYSFLDSDYDTLYRREERSADILTNFVILAVLIACLGLFGLASLTAEQRTKEIGVRKILGASVYSIGLLISKEFAKWILIANAIAWPVAYLLMKNWLQNYAYRTSLSWWIFALSGVLALFIAILTTSFQSIKAATANPVDSLRYE